MLTWMTFLSRLLPALFESEIIPRVAVSLSTTPFKPLISPLPCLNPLSVTLVSTSTGKPQKFDEWACERRAHALPTILRYHASFPPGSNLSLVPRFTHLTRSPHDILRLRRPSPLSSPCLRSLTIALSYPSIRSLTFCPATSSSVRADALLFPCSLLPLLASSSSCFLLLPFHPLYSLLFANPVAVLLYSTPLPHTGFRTSFLDSTDVFGSSCVDQP
jgi:hypothetical protein